MLNILKTYLKITHLATSLLLILIIFLNLQYWNLPSIGILFGVILFYLLSQRLGNWLFTEEKKYLNYLFGFLVLILLLIILGTAVYYPYKLNTLAIISILIILAISTSFLPKQKKSQTFLKIQHPTKWPIKLLLSGYYLLLLADFYLLFTHNTIEAIKTPWTILPAYFFILYFLTALTLIAITLYDTKRYRPLFLTMIFAFLSSSIALFVYKLGYGFDPFIHQATEKVIALKGVITPKPFYYIGQYSIVVIMSEIFQISVEWIDKLLVAIIASVFIPLSIFTFCRKIFQNKISRIFTLLFLSIPFSIFIMTTPQNLANTLLLILIIFGLSFIHNYYTVQRNKYLTIFLICLTVAILTIHPLTGIPALIFLILIIISASKTFCPVDSKGCKDTLLFGVFLISLLSCFALPFVFLANSGFSLMQIKFNSGIFSELISQFQLFHFNAFNFLQDFAYLYDYLLPFVIIILSISAGIHIILNTRYKILVMYFLTSVILLINYLLLKTLIDFDFVISYEQDAYADRILIISLYG